MPSRLPKNKKCWPKYNACRAKVVEAESEVPLAIAEAFRKGNLGIHDYYQLQNIQADTAMRESIAKDEKTAGDTVISE